MGERRGAEGTGVMGERRGAIAVGVMGDFMARESMGRLVVVVVEVEIEVVCGMVEMLRESFGLRAREANMFVD